MTLNEMIEKAEAIRGRDRFGPVTEEEFAAVPIVEEEVLIPGKHGDTVAYLITPMTIMKEPSAMVINYHGGGFIKGRLDRDKLFCGKIAVELNCPVLDVDYKLAPEHQFPVAYEESYNVMTWVCANAGSLGIDIERIGLLGHSAGGNLVAGTVIQALENRTQLPACIGIEYPPLDLKTDPGDKPRNGRDMPPERARMYNAFYCKPEHMGDFRISPLFTPLSLLEGFPRSLVISAGEDSLAAEDRQFAKKLSEAGVDAVYKNFEGSRHGFTINRMDSHKEAYNLFVSFLKESLNVE